MFLNIMAIRGHRFFYKANRFIGQLIGRSTLTNTPGFANRSHSSDNLDLRLRRFRFRAMNTGMKELDLILSEFIKANPTLVDHHLNEFESFLEMETCVIYDIIMGKIDYQNGNQMIHHIRSFAATKYK